MDGWMDKQIVGNTYGKTLLSHKKKLSLIHATTWINLENIMLRSQSQKGTYCTIPFKWLEEANPSRRKADEWSPRVREGMGSDYLIDTDVLLQWWKSFETRERWQLHNIVNALNAAELYALKRSIVLCEFYLL